jgi:hypothetical protein
MRFHPRLPSRVSRRDRRREVRKADLTLRHRWYRVLLHLRGMALRPRNIPWHWHHITREFHD